MENKAILIWAIAAHGNGISGSDRIFIEMAREWSKSVPVEIYTSQEGIGMCQRQYLVGKHLTINKVEKTNLPSNSFLKYLYKIFLGVKLGLSLQYYTIHDILYTHLYSSSDFWMDVFPCVILKIRYPKIKWVATWFMTAPNPLKGFSEASRKDTYKMSALLYRISQLPIKPLINKYADFVIVNNEDERKRFPEMDKKEKVIVLIGAVRLDEIKKYQSLAFKHKPLPKVYDAVFQGRFHPQKGVVELIDIWRKVVNKIPNAKLVMIGDGPLRKNVESRIRDLGLDENVKLFGYVFDGEEKYRIFSQSKIVVHPAFYDSGGMASAEAMAFGLPAIGFDLRAYDSYYPKGLIKSKDKEEFTNNIIDMLINNEERESKGEEAKKLIYEKYSWKIRANEIYVKLFNKNCHDYF